MNKLQSSRITIGLWLIAELEAAIGMSMVFISRAPMSFNQFLLVTGLVFIVVVGLGHSYHRYEEARNNYGEKDE